VTVFDPELTVFAPVLTVFAPVLTVFAPVLTVFAPVLTVLDPDVMILDPVDEVLPDDDVVVMKDDEAPENEGSPDGKAPPLDDEDVELPLDDVVVEPLSEEPEAGRLLAVLDEAVELEPVLVVMEDEEAVAPKVFVDDAAATGLLEDEAEEEVDLNSTQVKKEVRLYPGLHTHPDWSAVVAEFAGQE
jgi:hypothetical protein